MIMNATCKRLTLAELETLRTSFFMITSVGDGNVYVCFARKYRKRGHIWWW